MDTGSQPQARKKDRLARSALPKGRELEASALGDLDFLPKSARARDQLIENLHAVQARFGALHARHLKALSHLMGLSEAEVYEVASFYDHFDVVKEGEASPAPVTLRICTSLVCAMAGSAELLAQARKRFDPTKVRLCEAPCMGRCQKAPVARLHDREVDSASPDVLSELLRAGQTGPFRPDYRDFAAYRKAGGYRFLERLRSGRLSGEKVLDEVEASGLRGLGGAGFGVAQKWRIVRGFRGPRLMTVNADEGEVGTFKDRHYLESDPHAILEGALIAATVVEAERIYIYLRGEYPAAYAILETEIAALESSGWVRPGELILRRGAGAYICGEESAMLESLEGKRGLPRLRPPFIAESGLFSRPTLNHNVETLYWLGRILESGGAAFRAEGQDGHAGLRSFSVSGRVRNPGVKLAPAGISARALIESHAGGMSPGHRFKAYLPGGASGGILPASLADLPLDFGSPLSDHGAFVGSHAVIVLSDRDSIREVAANLMTFFAHESCGQCTPCRVGTQKLLALLRGDGPLDEDLLRDLESIMRDGSICGLGQAAPNPVAHLLTHFREELR